MGEIHTISMNTRNFEPKRLVLGLIFPSRQRRLYADVQLKTYVITCDWKVSVWSSANKTHGFI